VQVCGVGVRGCFEFRASVCTCVVLVYFLGCLEFRASVCKCVVLVFLGV
jgi:hypothetical protein